MTKSNMMRVWRESDMRNEAESRAISFNMTAPSMAAALAANLPAAAPPVSSVPAHEAIPASIAKLMDIEAEIPLAVVQLDGLVVSKILKHAREHPSGAVHGLLLGLDLDGVLQVSDSFSLPHNVADDDEKSAKATGMSCLSLASNISHY